MFGFSDQPGRYQAQLRRLGWLIGIFLVITWAFVLWPFPELANSWNAPFFSTDISRWSLLFISAFLMFICLALHQGKSWAWWGACFGIFTPMCFIVGLALPFTGGISIILLMNIVKALFFTSPRIDLFPTKLDAHLDEIARSLGLAWEEQPLWRLVQDAKAGSMGEAIKQYRLEYHVTWDQAELAIKFCMVSELELKSRLIKEHVQSMTGSSGDQKAITMAGVLPA